MFGCEVNGTLRTSCPLMMATTQQSPLSLQIIKKKNELRENTNFLV